MIKKLLLTLCFCLFTSLSFGALVEGTNCGFVTSAPSSDPTANLLETVDNNAVAGEFASPSNAVSITEIGWYCSAVSEEANFQVGLYSHNSGDDNPEARLQVTGDVAKGTTAGWKVATGLSWSITGSTIYHFAVHVNNTTTETYIDEISSAGNQYDSIYAQASLPDPWGTSSASGAYLIAIYAVYTTSGGAERRIITVE